MRIHKFFAAILLVPASNFSAFSQGDDLRLIFAVNAGRKVQRAAG